jgi:hypothetical protein
LKGFFLHLAEGKSKKVKDKKPDAFEIISSASSEEQTEVGPGQKLSLSETFHLEKNCLISDKGQSLYLVCGQGDISQNVGHLALNILPHADIEAVIMLMENSHSFVLKSTKSQKGWVEAKFKPPIGKLYPTLDQLTLLSCFDGDKLKLKYNFSVKKLEADSSALKFKKAKQEVVQEVEASKYHFSPGLINHDPLDNLIGEALKTVKSGF